jgi:hypothetical protein
MLGHGVNLPSGRTIVVEITHVVMEIAHV